MSQNLEPEKPIYYQIPIAMSGYPFYQNINYRLQKTHLPQHYKIQNILKPKNIYKMMNQGMSFEFELMEQENNNNHQISSSKILPDSYTDNQYHAVVRDIHSQQEAKLLMKLQTLLKTQSLLLEYEQKRKNQRLKEIQYVYTNGFNNFLWEKNRKKGLAPMVIINRKDILQLDQQLPDQLEIFRREYLKIQMSDIFTVDSKPSEAFLRDFYNFHPKWTHHISNIIEMQIIKASKIQSTFQSEYTFPSKVLSSLKYSASIQMFCTQVFRKPLKQIIAHNQELSLDFHHIYDPWLDKIKASADKGKFYNLYHFITRNNEQQIRNIKKIKAQICELMNIKVAQSQKIISDMIHFTQNKQAMGHLFAELGCEEIDEVHVNGKLTVLVWKKITANRKKIQSILTSFIDQILNSYYIFPKEVKYIMREYYRIAKKKFGEVKPEDVKSFFNKVIYSQLLFPEFMRLLEDNNAVTINVMNFNIPVIALLSQKILFGQQFYEKAKYSYFNQLITHYSQSIHDFMMNFLDEIHDIQRLEKVEKQVDPLLISFQAISFLYQSMRKMNLIRELQALNTKITKQQKYTFGSTSYLSKNVYVIFINNPKRNYETVLRPKQKMKRIFIEFLMLIQKIPQPVPLQMLLEQYKYTQSSSEESSVEIHANYLGLCIKQINVKQLSSEISQSIAQTKQVCKKVKIILEKQYNYAHNLEKTYMNKLKEKRKFNARNSIHDFIQCLLGSPTGFRYAIVDGKVCEVQEGNIETLQKCLSDIAQFYNNGLQGYDGLYHLLLEKVCEEVQNQGIVLEETMLGTRQIIGAKLYEMLKLYSYNTEEDSKIYSNMVKHSFIDLKLLQLDQYSDQQELIIETSLPILQKLKIPHSPDQLLKIFHEVTTIFQNIILINGKASDITADVQIPMMILILTKSKIKNLGSILKFIQKFCSEDINSSIMGQTLTLMSSVKYLIENFHAKQFNLSQEEYQELIEKQQRRIVAQTDRQYLIIDQQ